MSHVSRAELIEYCLAKPGAYLDNPWGEQDSVVKVGGKIFCFLGVDGAALRFSAKNTRAGIEEWRGRFPAHIGGAPYLHKQLWNRVDQELPGGPDFEDVRELIDASYDLIVQSLPKSKRP